MLTTWLVNHSTSWRGGERLFCFPYAGGSANVFRGWPSELPASVEIIAIQPPGKGARILELPCSSLTELIAGVLAELQPLLSAKPFSFFGHSNGALIAFELASVLQDRGLPLPRHLFLSASPAPWSRTFERPYSAMTDEEFIEKLRELDGTPTEVLADRELCTLALPGLRADFALAEGYKYSRPGKLSVPATVLYGRHDRISESQIRAWQEHIESEARFECVDGGHFFIHTHRAQITTLISRSLSG